MMVKKRVDGYAVITKTSKYGKELVRTPCKFKSNAKAMLAERQENRPEMYHYIAMVIDV